MNQHEKMTHIKKLSSASITMCILGALFYYYEYYLRVAPGVMSAELKQAFLIGEAAFGHLTAFYFYAYTPLQIPVGMIMDRFGPRRILSLACLLCAVGTYLFAATETLWIAQIGRFLVGFGSAFAYVGVLKLSNLWLPKKYFALVAGLCSALGMLGGISGQIVMSYLLANIGWQATLYNAMWVGLALTALLWFFLRDNVGVDLCVRPKSVDLCVRPEPAALRAHPFRDLKEIICSAQIWINGCIGCLTYLPIVLFADIWAINFLQTVGLSKQEAAFGASMLYLGFALGNPFWGFISDWIQSRRIPLMIGSFGSALFMGAVIFIPSTTLIWIYSLLFLGAFFAGAEILIFAVGNDIARPAISATVASFTNMFTMLGGMILPWVVGMMLDKSIQVVDNVAIISIHDYSMTLAVLPLGLVLSGILCILLKESYQFNVGTDLPARP